MAINQTGEKIVVKKGEILDGTPEIKSGLNIYFSIVIFKNAFKVEDILENGLLNRNDILYVGKWIYDGRVSYIYEQEYDIKKSEEKEPADKEPVKSESIIVTAKREFHNGNENNRGVVLEKDCYYYANEMDSNRNYKLVKTSISTGNKVVLNNDSAFNMRIIGNHLYFTNGKDGLSRINLETGAKDVLIKEDKF